MTVANAITIFRIVLIPCFAILWWRGMHGAALAVFGLHHAQRKRVVTIFGVVHIAEIHLILAREEKPVRWRKYGQRSCACTKNLEPVPSAQIHGLLIHFATKAVLLPNLGGIAPHQLCPFVQREAL